MRVKSLFWSFATAERPQPSFLCGTIHLGTPECVKHWALIEKYIDQYNRIYTESSIGPDAVSYLRSFTLLDADVDIHDYVTPRRWSKMRSTFVKYCNIDIDKMKMYRPLFILAAIQSNLVDGASMTPLDHMIWQYADDHDKSTYGVETPQEQVDIMLQMDMKQQYLNLIRISKTISKTRSFIKKLLKTYEAQDIDRLYQMSKASLGVDRGLLIQSRNTIMAHRIINHHNDEPSFFSFGAGHLGGGSGVLRKLKQNGATMKPIAH